MLWGTPDGSVLGDKIWDDIADLDELRSYPIEAMHSNVEKVYSTHSLQILFSY